MTTYWNFPAATGGLINSINNAGLETFRGNALESLTREICQNSLDAVKDKEEPVIVEFKQFYMDTDNFPKKDELLYNFQLSEQTWKGHNKKSEEFSKQAIKILNRKKISVLRISDFNTKGLEGAKEGKLGSPWSSLVKEAGSSNKDESSGGSFGIGKSAPFLNSDLRTLFYSSFDVTGYKSHIGVANIMSFQKSKDKITLGSGYYTNNENSNAITGLMELDSEYERVSTGTDIYITAFEPKQANWEEEIKRSVLFNFFVTVYQKKLVVKINNTEINHLNISELINELEDKKENKELKNYFHALTSSKNIKIPFPSKKYKYGIEFDEGEAELYLINGEDLNRYVLMTRRTGMRIFEQKRISGSISFTGILMITGKNMNNIFKQMENPAHNAWSEERFEKDPKLAKKIYKDLRDFIRREVKEHFQEKVTDEMDAVGLSDFLPNKNLISGESTNKTESLNANIKEINNKKIEPQKNKSIKRKGKEYKDFEEQLAGEYGITPTGDEGGNKGRNTISEGGNAGSGISIPGGNNELNPNEVGELDKKRKRKPSKDPIQMNRKYVCLDKNNGKYRFIISPKKSLENARLEFSVMGEQSNYALPIIQATTDNKDVTVEKCSTHTVYLSSLQKNKSFVLDVDIDYSDYCVLEVELYEN